ncbi:hypothetical protein ACIQVR_32270 [Streptomyces xanthochromogenes]|uniref:hypothetical protein n=1 Tax=Streptomyces xanthochromogenes TaxID=67384 RepID=UPI003818E268
MAGPAEPAHVHRGELHLGETGPAGVDLHRGRVGLDVGGVSVVTRGERRGQRLIAEVVDGQPAPRTTADPHRARHQLGAHLGERPDGQTPLDDIGLVRVLARIDPDTEGSRPGNGIRGARRRTGEEISLRRPAERDCYDDLITRRA